MDSISKTRLYSIFSGMKQRCYNPNNQHYKWYGGKGIAICDEWMGEDGLSRFMEWALNNGYEEHLTIDRITSSGPYSPDNCRWVTQSQNSKTIEHKVTYKLIPGAGIRYYRLFDLLQRRGMKKTDLLTLAGISPPTLAKLSKGETVTTDVIEKVCNALGVQPGDIMEIETSKKEGGA